MKKLLIAILLLVGVGAQAQTTINVTSNGYELTAPDTTNVHTVILDKGVMKLYLTRVVMVLFKFPEANTGTVKINTLGSTVTNSPAYSYETHPNGIYLNCPSEFVVKFSQPGDKLPFGY